MNERDTLKINSRGHLEIGGMDTTDITVKFGTPLYVFDERHIRDMMSVYRETIAKEYEGNGLVLYASKAFSCTAIYAIAKQENIGIDVVSGGELYTALKAGFPAEKIYMHGNNKLVNELEFALESKVGTIVVDSYREADLLDSLCSAKKVKQDVLIRINPGIEAHTHEVVQTARTDSKFGFSVADGTASEITAYILSKNNLNLKGFHCHIGSQIFEKQSFVLAVNKVMDFMADIKKTLKYEAATLNIGGGFGIWYNSEDPKLKLNDYADYLKTLIKAVKIKSKENNLNLPYLVIEPGRSIIGEAGITLYTVGAIKEIPGVKKYDMMRESQGFFPRKGLYRER